MYLDEHQEEMIHDNHTIKVFMKHDNDYSYHDSWNHLMPVVEKIERMGYAVHSGKGVAIYKGKTVNKGLIIRIKPQYLKIMETWLAVVGFINWWNKIPTDIEKVFAEDKLNVDFGDDTRTSFWKHSNT